jgi:hypothetical protein
MMKLGTQSDALFHFLMCSCCSRPQNTDSAVLQGTPGRSFTSNFSLDTVFNKAYAGEI